MKEETTLRDKIIHDLRDKKINVINLHQGTYDIFIAEENPFFLELKIIKTGLQGYKNNKRGFVIREYQCTELIEAKFPLYILTKDINEYRLFDNKWVRKHVEKLTKYDTYKQAIINEWRWDGTENGYPIILPITYEEAINSIVKIARKKNQ